MKIGAQRDKKVGLCLTLFNVDPDPIGKPSSLSISDTVHLYCAVVKRQISANWRTVTLIFLTGLFELF